MRKAVQSIILLSLCVLLAIMLNLFYWGVAVLVATLAMTTGVAILFALMAGVVWPVLAIAYVLFVTSNSSRAKASTPGASEPTLPSVEDPEHRQD